MENTEQGYSSAGEINQARQAALAVALCSNEKPVITGSSVPKLEFVEHRNARRAEALRNSSEQLMTPESNYAIRVAELLERSREIYLSDNNPGTGNHYSAVSPVSSNDKTDFTLAA